MSLTTGKPVAGMAAPSKPGTRGSAFTFSTPAFVQDLAGPAQIELDCQWNSNVEAFTQQAIAGNPWNSGYLNAARQFVPAPMQSYYFDPSMTAIPPGTPAVPVTWNAFPNRIGTYCGTNVPRTNPYELSQQQVWELGDTGYYTDASGQQRAFPVIPTDLCPSPDWSGATKPYGPYGPRGWMDEYCEWSVMRNGDGKITRVDFACENPEYWNTLWRVNPKAVATAYQEALNAGLPPSSPNLVTVSVNDLTLFDPFTSARVIDPFTGRPAYNPLNKWNSGPFSVRGTSGAQGGAMHLTSTPNTLQTEMGLAGGATVQRTVGNVDPAALICCAQYGQPNRNSDPHIGQSVNQVVGGPPPAMVSLADPVGLYIQMPDFSNYALPSDPNLPSGASVADCWQIVRGSQELTDPVTQQPYPGNFILHAVFQIPSSWIMAGVSFTVGDITIATGGQPLPIRWASQIAQTFDIGLFARPLEAQPLPAIPCVVNLDVAAAPPLPPAQAQPVQAMYGNVWDALYGTVVPKVGFPMNLASNSVIVPVPVKQGDTRLQLVLICGTAALGPDGELPAVFVPGGAIAVTINHSSGLETVTYAAPGNSYPSEFQLLRLSVDVAANAALGLYSIVVENPTIGTPAAVPGPAFLNVFPASGNCVP